LKWPKKNIKKELRSVDFILCSETGISTAINSLRPYLKFPSLKGSPKGHARSFFPIPLTESEDINLKIEQTKRMFELNVGQSDVNAFGSVVGNSLMNENQLYENVRSAVLMLLSYNLPLGIKNISSVCLKSTQGSPQFIFKYSEWFK